MKISIVTISYNQAEYINETLLSVLDQDYQNIEYIVVDAGSTDGSREIINCYSNRITKRIFEPDSGQANGLNKGFKYATGEIYGWINSDDLLLPGAIKTIVEFFKSNPNVDLVYGNGKRIDANGNHLKYIISDPFEIKRFIRGSVTFIQPSMFFKSSCFLKANGFNEKNISCWDSELIVDIALNGGKLVKLNKELSCFRIHDKSISGSGRFLNEYYYDRERIFEKVMHRKPNRYDALLVFLYRLEKIFNNPRKIFNI